MCPTPYIIIGNVLSFHKHLLILSSERTYFKLLMSSLQIINLLVSVSLFFSMEVKELLPEFVIASLQLILLPRMCSLHKPSTLVHKMEHMII